jgi:hypothetical protein
MEERFLSDAEISAQYDNFKIENLTIDKEDGKNYFTGVLEVSFPNADHPDFDDSKVDNFISYDLEGKRIAFDNWYPESVYLAFCAAIRKKLAEN